MKPLIGICTNYTSNDEVGKLAHLGGPMQEWHLLADNYINAVETAGGVPIIIPLYENPSLAIGLLKVIDGIIFTGGNDIDPQRYREHFNIHTGEICVERDEQELLLANHVVNNTKMPFLAICRGIQVINVANGGTLHQHINSPNSPNHFVMSSPIYHPVHKVKVTKDSRLHKIINSCELMTNSYHHQALNEIADCFLVSAMSEDGIIEAIETNDQRFGLGVQWHPEMMAHCHQIQQEIFNNFIREAIKFHW